MIIFGTVGVEVIRIFSLILASVRFFMAGVFILPPLIGNLRCLGDLPGVLDKRRIFFNEPVRLPFGLGKSSLLQVRFGGGVGLNGF